MHCGNDRQGTSATCREVPVAIERTATSALHLALAEGERALTGMINLASLVRQTGGGRQLLTGGQPDEEAVGGGVDARRAAGCWAGPGCTPGPPPGPGTPAAASCRLQALALAMTTPTWGGSPCTVCTRHMPRVSTAPRCFYPVGMRTMDWACSVALHMMSDVPEVTSRPGMPEEGGNRACSPAQNLDPVPKKAMAMRTPTCWEMKSPEATALRMTMPTRGGSQ